MVDLNEFGRVLIHARLQPGAQNLSSSTETVSTVSFGGTPLKKLLKQFPIDKPGQHPAEAG